MSWCGGSVAKELSTCACRVAAAAEVCCLRCGARPRLLSVVSKLSVCCQHLLSAVEQAVRCERLLRGVSECTVLALKEGKKLTVSEPWCIRRDERLAWRAVRGAKDALHVAMSGSSLGLG